MGGVTSGLIGAVVAIGLIALAERTQKSATISSHGWRVLKAGWFLNGIIVGGAAMAMLPAGVLLSGGSSLPDAASQNTAAALVGTASLAMTLYVAWIAHGQTIMWKGDKLRVRRVRGGTMLQRTCNVMSIRKNEACGEYRIAFRDGATLRFSAHMHGARELVAWLPRRY